MHDHFCYTIKWPQNEKQPPLKELIMHPPTKDQRDIGVDNPITDASDNEENQDKTRQEYKQDADINHQLARFGVAPARGAPVYGEWDDSVDLQEAIAATRMAKQAFNRLSPEIQKRFGKMEDLIKAIENGSFIIKEEDEKTQNPPPSGGKPITTKDA